MKLGELAAALGLELRGDADYTIHGVRDIELLGPGQDLSGNCVYIVESPAVLKRHARAGAYGAFLTTPELAGYFPRALIAPQKTFRRAMIKLLAHFERPARFAAGAARGSLIDETARVAGDAVVMAGAVVMADAVVGEKARLYPGVVVEPGAVVGAGSVLYPGVVVGARCRIGRNVIIHGNSVIGADGFGFHDDEEGRHKVPQIGNVVIDNYVEIGAGCTIDRATIESTTIGEHTKLDDQVHVGHNCRVGQYVYIVGNTALGGSVTVGDGAMISGMVIVKDHVRVGARSIIMGMSGVAKDTLARTAYFGSPARPARQMHKMHAALERLPELLTRVRALEAKAEAALT